MPRFSVIVFGIPEPSFTALQRSQGSGATEMLMTQLIRFAVLSEDDWTFTSAQSPASFERRHVGAEPLKP